jgi:2-hydroxy-3-oxopropionate reductase
VNIGFIGLGIMGKPMAEHLIDGGHTLYLQSRSGVPGELTKAGGIACDSAADVASHSEVCSVKTASPPACRLATSSST